MKSFSRLNGYILALLSFLVLASPAYAQSTSPYCNGGRGINTALGCIPTDTAAFVGAVLQVSVGLGGGIALILILYGVFTVTTSTGLPDKIKQGQEIITSAVSGLIFLVLSVVLLNLVGVKILAIPGL